MPRQPKPEDADKETRQLQDDTADPGDLDPSAPHDRGSVQNGRWLSGIETAEEQVMSDKEAWKKGLTQNE